MDSKTKKAFVEKDNEVSMNHQLSILGLSKGYYYYKTRSRLNNSLALTNINCIYEANPVYGYRKIHAQLVKNGLSIGKDRVLKYMQQLCLRSICPTKRKNTTIAVNTDQKYPYEVYYNKAG